jgi:hypothetical protein
MSAVKFLRRFLAFKLSSATTSHTVDILLRSLVDRQNRTSGNLSDIFSPFSFFTAGEPLLSSVELFALMSLTRLPLSFFKSGIHIFIYSVF